MKESRRIYIVYPGYQGGTWYVSAVASNESEAVHSLHNASPRGRVVTEQEADADPGIAGAITCWKAGDDSVADLWDQESEREDEEDGDFPGDLSGLLDAMYPLRKPGHPTLRLVKG